MSSPLIEISAAYLHERFRFANADGDIIIGEARLTNSNGDSGTLIAIKGPAEIDELQPHLSYRFYGRWSEYKNKRTGQTERQFAYQTFVRQQPHGRAGVIRYLQQAPHVGYQTADKLWEKFGGDAVRILREQPEVAAAAAGTHFSQVRASEAAAWLRDEQALESCTIDLIDLLGGRGFPKATAREAVRLWGNKAAEFISRDPHILMLAGFRGCGWKKTDAMYLSLGRPPATRKRQALCGWYALAKDKNGHTWFPVEVAIRGIEEQISGARVQPAPAFRLAKRHGILAFRRTDGNAGPLVDQGGRLWIAEGKNARQEAHVARRVAELLRQPARWPDLQNAAAGPTDHQLAELARAISGSVGILTGGPGTGKTFLTATLIKLCLAEFGSGSVAVAAPTNKAAHRLKMALVDQGIEYDVTSIHRLLGVESSQGGWKFKHGEYNPLPHRVLILDEGSMIATDLMSSVLSAIAYGTMVLIVADINQLPPIQHGAPVRDMLTSGCVPFGQLTETHRNAGTIVLACDDIRQGRRFRTASKIRLNARPPQNFKIIEAGNPQQQIEKLLQVIERAKEAGHDPIWDIQAMVAVNKWSEVSRKAINSLLQNELNSGGFTIPGNPFRVNDKVICTDNGLVPCVDEYADYADADGKVFVANGEFGQVDAVEEKLVTVTFPFPDRQVKFPRGKVEAKDDDDGDEDDDSKTDTGCALDLAYAATVWKMQGSETPIALPILDESATRHCGREFFFTAISRGKLLSLPIGKRATADAMCKTARLSGRKTFMSELIRMEVEKLA